MLWKGRRVKDSWYLNEGVLGGRVSPLMGLAFSVPCGTRPTKSNGLMICGLVASCYCIKRLHVPSSLVMYAVMAMQPDTT